MESEDRQAITTNNYAQLSDPTFIKLKLDTSPLLQRIEVFLSAKRKVILRDEETGSLYEDVRIVGKPYANEEGVYKILSMIDMRANNHTVQGNFTREECWNFLSDIRKELTVAVIINAPDWEIDDSQGNDIIDTIMGYLIGFLTRTIDNKERESLTSQFMSREIINNKSEKGSILKSFAGGGSNE